MMFSFKWLVLLAVSWASMASGSRYCADNQIGVQTFDGHGTLCVNVESVLVQVLVNDTYTLVPRQILTYSGARATQMAQISIVILAAITAFVGMPLAH